MISPKNLRLGVLLLLLGATGLGYGSHIAVRGGYSDDFCLQEDAHAHTFLERIENWQNKRYAHAISVPLFYDLVDGSPASAAPWWILAALGVAFHLAAVALFFRILTATGLPIAAIWAGTVFFALFPLKNEAVLWAGGWLAYLPPTVLALAALHSYLTVLRSRQPWRLSQAVLVTAACIFALFSVELFAILLGAVLLARVILFRNAGANRRDIAVILLLLLGISAVFGLSQARIKQAALKTQGYYKVESEYHSAIERGVNKRVERILFAPFAAPLQAAKMPGAGSMSAWGAIFLCLLAAGFAVRLLSRDTDAQAAPPLPTKSLWLLALVCVAAVGGMFLLLFSIRNGFSSRVLYLPTLASGASLAFVVAAILQSIKSSQLRRWAALCVVVAAGVYGAAFAVLAIEDQLDYAAAWRYERAVMLGVAQAARQGHQNVVVENTDRKIGHIKAPIFADEWSLGCAMLSEFRSATPPRIFLKNERIQMTAPEDAALVTIPVVGQPR